MALTIYELRNVRRQEAYVGVTKLPLQQQFIEDCKARRAATRNWTFADAGKDIFVREVESLDSDANASQFLKIYIQALSNSGWQISRFDDDPYGVLIHSQTVGERRTRAAPKNDLQFVAHVVGLLLKGWALVLLSLAALIGVALFTFLHLIDMELVQTVLTAQMQELLHRPVQIEGVALTPQGISLSGLKIGEVGYPDRHIVQSPTALITIKIPPLLHRRLEFSDIKLLSPLIRLARNEQGHWNFTDLSVSSAPIEPVSVTKLFPPISFSVDNIDIVDGELRVEDRLEDKKPVSERINLHVHKFDLNNPFEFTLNIGDINPLVAHETHVSFTLSGTIALASFDWKEAYLAPDNVAFRMNGKISEISGSQMGLISTIFLDFQNDVSSYSSRRKKN